jgi:hypothetical protein
VGDLQTKIGRVQEYLVQMEDDRRRAMFREALMMEEVPVSTDALRQSELEPDKESVDGVTPSCQPEATTTTKEPKQ